MTTTASAASTNPLYEAEEPDRPAPAAPAGIRRSRGARGLVAVAVAVYVGCFSYWTIRNHHALGTFGFDLGIYDQGLWLLSRFRAPFVTIIGRNLFGDHTSFILLPLVPAYWVAPSANVLLVAQAAALGLAAVPAFLVAREKLASEWLAAGVAVAYLANPAVGWTNFEQFHPDVFEVPLLLLAFWFMIRRRWTGYFVCLAALLLVKEDVPLLTFALGLYVAVKHDRRVGLWTCAVSALWFVLSVWVLLPLMNGVGSLNSWRVPFGGPGGLMRTALTDPTDVIDYVTAGDRPFYVWQLLAPVALLCLLAPGVLAIAIGPLASNVLSTYWYQYHLQYHYTTLIVPVVVIAAVFGIARFRSPSIRQGLVVAMCGASVITGLLWGPTPLARTPAWIGDPTTEQTTHLSRALDLIPSDAAVSTSYNYVTHLTHRKLAYEFPEPWVARWWGVFDQEGQRLPTADAVDYLLLPKDLDPEFAGILRRVRSEAEWATVYDGGGVVLLERR